MPLSSSQGYIVRPCTSPHQKKTKRLSPGLQGSLLGWGPLRALRLPDIYHSLPSPSRPYQIIANHHMQSISFASGGDPVSWGTEERRVGKKRLGTKEMLARAGCGGTH